MHRIIYRFLIKYTPFRVYIAHAARGRTRNESHCPAGRCLEAGDVALYCSRWNLRGTDPAGNPVQMRGRSSGILRCQPDGNWLIALDNPWGTDIVA